MPLESANYISQLVPTNPLSTDTVSQADDHLRTIKLALKNTFPNLDAPVTVTPAQLNSPVPKGVVVMWSGTIATIPAGYAICDGTNGTPDLRKRFVYGANTTDNPVNATGGSASTGMAGSHTHTINGTTETLNVTTTAVQSGTGTTVASAVTANSHTHSANLVGDHQHTSLPPYLALAYIMKV
jgi:hypothetical protein